MKHLAILCIGLLTASCATRRSFHEAVMEGFVCQATYHLVESKLDEAAHIFIQEFERLQRAGAKTREARMALLGYSVEHFPESHIEMLVPLLQSACVDPDRDVRLDAMYYIETHFGEFAVNLLKRSAQHPSPEVRADILKWIEKIKKKTDD